jgi:hypothetical protein
MEPDQIRSLGGFRRPGASKSGRLWNLNNSRVPRRLSLVNRKVNALSTNPTSRIWRRYAPGQGKAWPPWVIVNRTFRQAADGFFPRPFICKWLVFQPLAWHTALMRQNVVSKDRMPAARNWQRRGATGSTIERCLSCGELKHCTVLFDGTLCAECRDVRGLLRPEEAIADAACDGVSP